MRLAAIKITQTKVPIFVAKIKLGELIKEDDFCVDKWDPAFHKAGSVPDLERQGYQRELMSGRLPAIAKYIADPEMTMPTAILLNARDSLTFHPEKAGGSLGELVFSQKLWVVDGQHRIAGARVALRNAAENGDQTTVKRIGELEVPVIIMDTSSAASVKSKGDAKLIEMRQFSVINTEQKGVQTNLAEELMAEQWFAPNSAFRASLRGDNKEKRILWKVRATRVADMLHMQLEGPWNGRIKLPNMPKGQTIANRNSFVSSLKPLLSGNGPLAAVSDLDFLAQAVNNYWLAIQGLMPEAFSDPSSYVTQKTPGMFSLHLLAEDVMRLAGKDYTISGFTRVLKPVFSGQYGNDWWRSSVKGEARRDRASIYNSAQGFKILASLMQDELKAPDIAV